MQHRRGGGAVPARGRGRGRAARQDVDQASTGSTGVGKVDKTRRRRPVGDHTTGACRTSVTCLLPVLR